jgi:hypothetical protein
MEIGEGGAACCPEVVRENGYGCAAGARACLYLQPRGRTGRQASEALGQRS